MLNPSNNRRQREDPDDDDRKPPAQEIVATKVALNFRRRRTELPNSTETSVASTASSSNSDLAGTAAAAAAGYWNSPVARAVPRPSRNNNNNNASSSKQATHYLSSAKKNQAQGKPQPHGRRQEFHEEKDVPSLIAASPRTPFSSNPSHAATAAASSSIIPATTTTSMEMASIRIHRLQRHLLVWLAIVLFAATVFVSQVLPTAAFTSLLFILASTGLMVQSIGTTLRLWFSDMVLTGPGLGRLLLPASLYQTLTETSLHEYMTNPSFGIDNGHLLLYFLPLTADQLHDSIQRLAPAHQDRLHRPGLGHLILGDAVMRLLLGEPRVVRRQQQEQEEGVHRIIVEQHVVSPMADEDSTPMQQQPRSRGPLLLLADNNNDDNENELDDDDEEHSEASDLGMDISPADLLVGGLNEQGAMAFVRRLGLEDRTTVPTTIATTSPETTTTIASTTPASVSRRVIASATANNADKDTAENEPTNPSNPDMEVVMDAFWMSAYSTVFSPLQDYVTTSLLRPTVRRVQMVNGWAVRLSVIVSTTALSGYGLLWLLGGSNSYSPATIAAATLANSAPWMIRREGPTRASTSTGWNSGNTVAASILGGASMGLALYTLHYVRRSIINTTASTNASLKGKTQNGKSADK